MVINCRGDCLSKFWLTILLVRKVEVSIASLQRKVGALLWINNALALSWIISVLLSATPFFAECMYKMFHVLFLTQHKNYEIHDLKNPLHCRS